MRPTLTDSSRTVPAMLTALAASIVVSALILAQPSPFALKGDNETLTHPLLADAFRQLGAGRLPVWTTGRWGGSPLIGDPVVGALYAPYYLAYAATDSPHARALDISAGLHLALLTVGMVWFLLTLGVCPAVALATTALLLLNPTVAFIARSWAQYWAALAYWPWLLGAVARSARAPALRWGLLAAGCLAAQVYAGYPQFALYSGTAALLWMVMQPGPSRWRRTILAILVALGAAGLAAPQVLPGLAMAQESIRMGPRGAALMAGFQGFALAPADWFGVLGASPMGRAPCKIAPPVVVLALLGATQLRFAPLFLAGLAGACALLATGPNPVYRALQTVPPFSLFGAPVKLFYLAAFATVVLAGLGLERVVSARPLHRRVAIGLVAASALPAFCTLLPDTWWALVAVAAVLCVLPARSLGPVMMLTALAGSAVFLVTTRALVIRDPWYSGPFRTLLQDVPEDPDLGLRGGRFLALGGQRNIKQAGTNFGALWGVEALNGVGALAQWRQLEVTEFAHAGDPARLVRQWGADPILAPAGGKLESKLLADGFQALASIGPLRLLSDPEPPAPRYQLVPHARAVPSAIAIEEARAGNALTETSVLIEATALDGGGEGDPGGELEIMEQGQRSAHLRARVDRSTWLVARQPFYRNWRATIDDRPATIYPAGGFFLAFLVARGEHEVTVTYEEPGLLAGTFIAAFTALLLPVLLRRACPATPPARPGAHW